MAKKTDTSKTEEVKEESKKEILRHLDGTIELNLVIPVDTVLKERAKIEKELVKGIELPGFRKGKAPEDLAKSKIDPEKINEQLLKSVVTEEYKKAVEKHKLQPIITPQIHIEAFETGKDLKFSAKLAEEPQVELGDYKKEIKDLTSKSKIIVKKGQEPKKPSIDEVISAGMSKAKIAVPSVIIDREATRLLSQIVDEVKTLGMTLESYLESKKITAEQLREEYKMRAEKDIKLEFFLRKVADEEKIVVNNEDIKNAIKKIEDEKQKKEIEKNPYLVANIIRQQKTIDFLTQI